MISHKEYHKNLYSVSPVYQQGKLFAGENMRGLSPTSAQMAASICADGRQQTHATQVKNREKIDFANP